MTSADAEPQGFVEAALAASAADGCVVIATEHSEANLRFARNSLTTNGQMRSRDVTVISRCGQSAAPPPVSTGRPLQPATAAAPPR